MKVRLGSKGWPAGRFGLACAVVGLLAAWSLTAGAAVRRVSLEECVRDSDRVFVGTVARVTTRWGDTGKMIWTDYLFQVEEVWKGAPANYITVSVAGGTVGDRSIIVTHVPTFDLHGTYVVYAYDNDKLTAEGVVGVEQGLFREVTDAADGRRVLLDAYGYLMELAPDGRIQHGRLTRPVDGIQKAEVLSAEELRSQQKAFEAEFAHAPMPQPVYRDGNGNVLHPPATPGRRAKALEAPQPGEALTREELKSFTLSVLATPPPPEAAPACPPVEGRQP